MEVTNVANKTGVIFLLKILVYWCTPATAAAAIILNKHIAFPNEAPFNCMAKINSVDKFKFVAVFNCTEPKIILETVVLPVINVPITPINGLIKGYAFPVFAKRIDIVSIIEGISDPLDSINCVIPNEGNRIKNTLNVFLNTGFKGIFRFLPKKAVQIDANTNGTNGDLNGENDALTFELRISWNDNL